MEIERKYKVGRLPANLSQYEWKKIEQGYLCHKPTLRIRKSNKDYILTYKSKLGLPERNERAAIFNKEVELSLSKDAYYELREKINGHMVEKTRYIIPLSHGLVAELDIFEGILKGLVMVEVEFPDEETSNQFIPPPWFGKELTRDMRFTNHYLSGLDSYEELELGIDELGYKEEDCQY